MEVFADQKDTIRVLELSISKIEDPMTYGLAKGKIDMANYLGILSSNLYCSLVSRARKRAEETYF